MSTPVMLLLAVGVAAVLAILVTRGSNDSESSEPSNENTTNEAETVTKTTKEETPKTEVKADPVAEAPAEEVATEAPAEEAANEAPAEETADEAPAEETADETASDEAPTKAPQPEAAVTTTGLNGDDLGPNVVALLEVSGDHLGGAARATLAAAVQLAKATDVELHVCCLGSATQSAKEACVEGVTAVHTITNDAFNEPVAELYTAAALTALQATQASIVVAPASSVAKDYLPRVAETLGAGMISEAIAVDGPKTFKRALWAGSAIATVEAHSERLALTIQPTAFDPVKPGDGSTSAIEFEVPATKTRFIEFAGTVSERPSLGDAEVVVAGGRGCGVSGGESEFDFGPVENLADSLGGAIGASRAVVDAGWVPNDWQIGQTGKTVAPKLYIACGISGAIQHVAGMKGSKTIVAINKDPEAPIFQVADYGLVGDLHQLCPELIEKISNEGLKVG